MSDDRGVNEWNGIPIPPRPPLPASAPAAPAVPPVAPLPAAPGTRQQQRAGKRIGMPPGMEPSLDTVPSSEGAAPIPVSKPEFGVAPFPPVAAPPVPAAPSGPVNSAPVTAPVAARADQPAVHPRLILPDGAVLPLAAGLIVGRDPQVQEGYDISERARLHDVERSVSKTHAILGVSAGRVWVVDLNSTNGTVLVAADGTETLCTPEVATQVPPDTDVRFGEYRVRVALD